MILAALGKYVAERTPWYVLPSVFCAGAIGGALWVALLIPQQFSLLGASEGVYGVVGAMTYQLLIAVLAHRQPVLRAFSLIIVLLGLQLVFAALQPQTSWNWTSLIGASAFGFIAAALLSTGDYHFRNLIYRD